MFKIVNKNEKQSRNCTVDGYINEVLHREIVNVNINETPTSNAAAKSDTASTNENDKQISLSTSEIS